MTDASTAPGPVLEQALTAAEVALQRLGETLLTPQIADLPAQAQALVLALRECALAMQSVPSPSTETQNRLRSLGAALAQLHSALGRNQAQVAQQLRVLLPSGELATYGRGNGTYLPGRSAASSTSLNA